MKIRILMLVVMLGIVGRVEAIFHSAGTMLSKCESADVGDLNVCHGYLAGIADATNTWTDWGDMSKQVCMPPSGVRTSQLRKIYTKIANEHPEALHLSASGMAIKAFMVAFPCK